MARPAEADGTIAKVADPKDELVQHLPALRAFALSLTREGAAADDLVQDTIVKAWTNMDKFQVGTNLRAWLFTILRNTFYSARRKTRREVSDTDGIHAARQATRPEHDGRLAMNDVRVATSAPRLPSFPTSSARRWSWSAHPAFPMKKRPR